MSNNWSIDFASLDPSRNRGLTVADPPGFTASYTSPASSKSATRHKREANQQQQQQSVTAEHDQETLKVKKAWDAALSPGKNIPMNAFMLWMSGNGVQIFSVMITGMLFFQPIKALMGIDSVFERYESPKNKSRLLWPKVTFVALQLLTMALGLYKCSSMGLLPTATSDWLAFMEPKQFLEYSAI